jgi:hypothetical protein
VAVHRLAARCQSVQPSDETGGGWPVENRKEVCKQKPNTNVELTPVGKQRIANHWIQLDQLKNLSKVRAEAQH